jgi:hypothetical protein
VSPRNGRPPSDNPKGHRKSYRLSDGDMQKLDICIKETGLTATDIIRKGINLVYQEVIKKKE